MIYKFLIKFLTSNKKFIYISLQYIFFLLESIFGIYSDYILMVNNSILRGNMNGI